MRKNLLLIDYMSPKGHENYDLIQIKSLLALGYHITLVGRKGHFDCVPQDHNIDIKELPEWCFRKFRHLKPLCYRLQEIFTLLYIYCKLTPKKYDWTVMLCYDILSVFFFRTKGKVVLIDHNNVGQLDNSLKLFLTKAYPDYAHIALNKQMHARLEELLPKHKVRYIPHGLVPAFVDNQPSIQYANKEKFLFCPVNQNFDKIKVSSLFNSDSFLDYLKSNNIVFYIKYFEGIREDRKEIQVIKDRISDLDYKFLIKNSIAVILPYTEEFRYRCSGILFECVANDTTVICKRNPATSIYNGEIDMYEFDDDSQLIECIEKRIDSGKRIYDKTPLSPTSYWKEFLN